MKLSSRNQNCPIVAVAFSRHSCDLIPPRNCWCHKRENDFGGLSTNSSGMFLLADRISIQGGLVDSSEIQREKK